MSTSSTTPTALTALLTASWPEFESFRYYSEGVYLEEDCATKSKDLDHAVVLFGYGTTEEGESRGA